MGLPYFHSNFTFDQIHFSQSESGVMCGTICSLFRPQYVYFFTENINSSLSVRKLFTSANYTSLEGNLATSGTIHTVKVNNIHSCSVAEIFPPYTMYTRTRGRPFWGGYVGSRGCLSNLMLLIEDSIFNTKYHLQSRQDFILKIC